MNGGEGDHVPAAPTGSLDWKFSQVFGEQNADEEVYEGNIISTLEFDKSGDHLAIGDRGGKVVLFERSDKKEHGECRRDAERINYSNSRHPEFRYMTEFQSHALEFDCLNNLHVEEKIKKIRWWQSANGALFLLSTNDKKVKFWKVRSNESSHMASCKRVYGGAHDYNINSISCNSDGETFISADDLRINLWNLEINSQSFNIVDLKPATAEDLTELITSAEFHPTHCNTLAYSSSNGSIRLVDLRQSALCDNHSKLFEESEARGSRSYFSELIAPISDIKFGKDGRFLLSRDYMTLKLWDINMDSGPVSTFQVHEYLRQEFHDLYDNDCFIDKFECCLSGNGQRVATGSYSNLFRVFGTAEGSTEAAIVEANKNPMRRQVQMPPSRAPDNGISCVVRRGGESPGLEENRHIFDLTTKILHLAWHPSENSIACAVNSSLYMYYA